MNQPEYARRSTPLEEAITVLFCLVDDVYQNINPNAQRYENLKKLSDSEVVTLALFQQLRGVESRRSGVALAFVGQATSGIFPHNVTLGWLFSDPGYGFQAGILLTSVGLVLMGIATLRAGVLPHWCGFGIIALVVFLALGAYGGFVVVGLIWLALGYALWSGKSEVIGNRAYAGERRAKEMA